MLDVLFVVITIVFFVARRGLRRRVRAVGVGDMTLDYVDRPSRDGRPARVSDLRAAATGEILNDPQWLASDSAVPRRRPGGDGAARALHDAGLQPRADVAGSGAAPDRAADLPR